jgi:hypothetical protein
MLLRLRLQRWRMMMLPMLCCSRMLRRLRRLLPRLLSLHCMLQVQALLSLVVELLLQPQVGRSFPPRLPRTSTILVLLLSCRRCRRKRSARRLLFIGQLM